MKRSAYCNRWPFGLWFSVAAVSALSAHAETRTLAYVTTAPLSVIDVATNMIIATVPVSSGPDGIAISPDTTRAYVANSASNDVTVIDTATNGVVVTIPVGQNPIGIALTPDSRFAYVANFATPGSVSVIDTTTNHVTTTIPTAVGPDGIATTPDGARLYTTHETYNPGVVSVIGTATNTVSTTFQVGANPRGVVFSPDGARAYVTNTVSNSVSVIDTATNAVTTTIPVGGDPEDIAISPDGGVLYVANADSNTVSVINTATNAVATSIAVGVSPRGVAVTPDGAVAYVVNTCGTSCDAPSGTVSVIDTATRAVTTTIAVGSVPVRVAIARVAIPPTPTPTVVPTLLDAGKAIGRPGGIVCLPVTLASGAIDVASATNDLSFDSAVFSFASCTINPAVTAFGLNKMLTLTPIDAGTERVTVSSANSSPIPDGLLYTCTLGVTPGTVAGSYPVANTPTASDQTGVAIPNVVGSTGQVIVTNCTGDCNGDGRVKIGEVIRCVNLFLGQPLCSFTDPALNCPVADASLDGHVSVGEVIQCVNRFLNGC